MKEPLKLSLTKEMRENHISPENSELLGALQDIVEKNPGLGEIGKFSLLYSGINGRSNGQYTTVFFAVNRTENTIKNIRFTLNVSVAGTYLMREYTVELDDEYYGDLAVNSAFPVVVYLNETQWDLLSHITNENLSITISEYSDETV